MNWPLFWALALTFGFVIGNIMLVKRSATQKMPSLKDLPNPADAAPKQRLNNARTGTATVTKVVTTTTDQTPSNPG